ncbi:MAG: hypothetical protein DME87_03790 [Verrucomicrobia bacterium]|nr:MAG: hypothetical protein DME87_03790 [Verrucomicrobiota bacterium]
MIRDANQHEYVIERPQATEPNWRYRPSPDSRNNRKRTVSETLLAGDRAAGCKARTTGTFGY